MQTLFDILKNISHGKDISLIDESLDEYNSFIINRFLSSEKDCLFAVSMLNEKKNIPKRFQYLFLINGIDKRNRFFKFEKKEKKDDLNSIVKYYNCSYNIAKEYLKILTDEEIEIIEKRMCEGGNL